mmetsp:Transcript_24943/g.38739  ORF Transcript_24943/g.38739 Transcript_24943/m.38739 type:complete len:88 (+) Transcript_24943:1167-1430(+)
MMDSCSRSEGADLPSDGSFKDTSELEPSSYLKKKEAYDDSSEEESKSNQIPAFNLEEPIPLHTDKLKVEQPFKDSKDLKGANEAFKR